MIFWDRVKTVLSSTIVYDVITMKKDPGIAVAYFYLFNDTQKQNVDSMLKSIVLQLAQSLDDVPSISTSYISYTNIGGSNHQ
jgi:hypothetical protein